jgi:hypothetical protein
VIVLLLFLFIIEVSTAGIFTHIVCYEYYNNNVTCSNPALFFLKTVSGQTANNNEGRENQHSRKILKHSGLRLINVSNGQAQLPHRWKEARHEIDRKYPERNKQGQN